ncbi:MAG: CCA tRNA nucleotidyltransferase, partial [Rhizobiales bacterium]|nr:CCA tRNA nucleotidyltransferase [Hyphomicrobiales bacterium]
MSATTGPRSLAGAGWLEAAGVRRVFAALGRDVEETRVIGGAGRDALSGLPVGDVDFATTAVPGTVVARAAAAGIKA